MCAGKIEGGIMYGLHYKNGFFAVLIVLITNIGIIFNSQYSTHSGGVQSSNLPLMKLHSLWSCL